MWDIAVREARLWDRVNRERPKGGYPEDDLIADRWHREVFVDRISDMTGAIRSYNAEAVGKLSPPAAEAVEQRRAVLDRLLGVQR